MAFRNISVLLTANSTSLRSQLNQAATQVDRFANKVQGHHKGVISSSKLMQTAVTGGAAAVAGALAYSVVQAARFEQSMRNVNSISKLSEGEFKRLGASVLNLSTQLPTSANDLAEGLYEIASSGFQGAEGLKVLTASGIAASAGMTTTKAAAGAITAVLNAYGRGAEDATDVSDALFQTVNLGVISFEELSGVIGDVVGTAAAASVDINQVGAAIATMTLTGISGAEAGTSLGRTLQSIIQPGDALSKTFQQLGYQSGASALKQKGLQGVIEDLRVATGGSIESLLALFPEIRAARGALALMSNGGKNYAKVAAEIEDKNKRAGATMAAFKEQSKAVAFQWDIFVNKINRGAIILGTKLLPVLLSAMKIVGRFGAEFGHAMSYLAPFIANITQIGVDLWTVLQRMADAAAPVVKAMLAIAGAGIIVALNTLSEALADIVHFVTNNRVAFALLASTITVSLLPALYRVAAALATSIFEAATIAVYRTAGAALKARAAFVAMGIAGGAAAAAATAGLTLGILAIQSMRDEARKGRQAVDDLYDSMRAKDGNNPILMGNSLSTLQRQLTQAKTQAHDLGTTKIRTGFTSTTLPFKIDLHLPGGKDAFSDATTKADELKKKVRELEGAQGNAARNLETLAVTTGMSWEQLITISDKEKINLTKGYDESAAARQRVIDKIHEMETASATSAKVLASTTDGDIAKMEALAKAIEETAKKASDAFTGANDVIAGFKLDDGEKAAKATAKATDKLTAAQQKLSDLEARQATKKRLTVADDQALARARQAVADATKGVSAAEATRPDSKGTQLRNFYKQQIKESDEFVKGINTLTLRGLDPEMIKRLLEAGPKAAAPVIEALLSDHSGKLIAMANESEAKLREINTKVVEFSRLTTLAVSSSTDKMARDLGVAMQIASQNMSQGAKATVESIARAIGKPTDEVLRIAKEYGITLNNAVQEGFSTPLKVPPIDPEAQANAQARGEYILPSGKHVPLATGGYVSGPGTGTSDSIPALLSNGEYVVRAASVRALGVENMHRINAYASGGLVGRATSGLAVRGSGGDSYTTIHKYEFNGPIVGVKMEDAERYAARKRQLGALAGGGQ